MKMRKLFVLPAICCALALTLGACGEGKQKVRAKITAKRMAGAKAMAEAKAKAEARKIFNLSDDGKTITGVKDKGIKSVVIPNGVTSIGNSAFRDCSSLTSITIPDSVTSIGDGAFSGVQSVQVAAGNPVFSVDERGVLINKKEKKLLYVPANVSGYYMIPSSVTSIGNSAFRDCSSLKSITIPNRVTSIGNSAFRDCSSLKSITIPDRVTSIGERAFRGCSSLTSITIPDSVTSIGWSAFWHCSSLRSVTIGNGVTSIGEKAFSGCPSLTSLTIPATFTDEDVNKWDVPYGCQIIRK